MNELQIFSNPEFGEIRTVMIGDNEYFFGTDVASALEYKRPRKAVTDHCKGVLSQDGSVLGQDDEPIITEGDMYRLIVKASSQSNSKAVRDKADKFEKWIFDEILPTLRKTGSYNQKQLPMTTDEKIQLLAQGNVELNEKIDNVRDELEALKMDLPILPIEADRITEAVKKKGVSVLGGKNSPAYSDRGLRQRLYNNLYANLKYNFGVRSYKSIKRSQTDKAVEVILRYEPPFFLAEEISGCNAQISMNFN